MLRVDEQKQPHILGEGEMENIVLKDLVQSLRGSLMVHAIKILII